MITRPLVNSIKDRVWVAAVPHIRHPGMFLAGLNLPGADLNSLWLVRRMKYMDVFHNPVT
jgi:hypothetical protein